MEEESDFPNAFTGDHPLNSGVDRGSFGPACLIHHKSLTAVNINH